MTAATACSSAAAADGESATHPASVTASSSFKGDLYRRLHSDGVIGSFQSQLRQYIIQQLKHSKADDAALSSPPPPASSPMSDDDIVALSLVYYHVRDSALPRTAVALTSEVTPNDIQSRERVRRRLLLTEDDGRSLLTQIISRRTADTEKPHRETQKRTETTNVRSIADVEFALKQFDARSTPPFPSPPPPADIPSLDARMLSYQIECNERMSDAIRIECERFRTSELIAMRQAERAAHRNEMIAFTTQQEAVWRDRLTHLKHREESALAELKKKESSAAAEHYAHRQTLMNELNRIKEREEEINRLASLTEESLSAAEAVVKSKECALDEAMQNVKIERATLNERIQSMTAALEHNLSAAQQTVSHLTDELDATRRHDSALAETLRQTTERVRITQESLSVATAELSTLRPLAATVSSLTSRLAQYESDPAASLLQARLSHVESEYEKYKAQSQSHISSLTHNASAALSYERRHAYDHLTSVSTQWQRAYEELWSEYESLADQHEAMRTQEQMRLRNDAPHQTVTNALADRQRTVIPTPNALSSILLSPIRPHSDAQMYNASASADDAHHRQQQPTVRTSPPTSPTQRRSLESSVSSPPSGNQSFSLESDVSADIDSVRVLNVTTVSEADELRQRAIEKVERDRAEAIAKAERARKEQEQAQTAAAQAEAEKRAEESRLELAAKRAAEEAAAESVRLTAEVKAREAAEFAQIEEMQKAMRQREAAQRSREERRNRRTRQRSSDEQESDEESSTKAAANAQPNPLSAYVENARRKQAEANTSMLTASASVSFDDSNETSQYDDEFEVGE